MKPVHLLLALPAAAFLLLGGCSSRYAVVTSDYSVHVATSKPEIDTKTDTVTFKDENGKEVTFPRNDLKQIKELD